MLLRSLQSTPVLFDLVSAMMKNAWDQRRQQVADVILSLRKELRDIDTQTDKLLERIIESDSPAVTSAYENKSSSSNSASCS